MHGIETGERWEIIRGFDCYEVSDCGTVRNRKTKKILRQQTNQNGYKTVYLYSVDRNRRWLVHRLVAEQFIENDKNLPQINHKDGDKANNCIDNLEWCTNTENQRHRRNVLKQGLQPVLCVETQRIYESVKSAAEKNNSHIPNIVRACQCGSTASGVHWQYVERK